MADRIVIMDRGEIVQQGVPEEVYDKPASAFIASFMGAENTIELDIAHAGGGNEIRADGAGAPVRWTGEMPAGRVRAYFRDDVARIVGGGDRSDMIVLPARIVSRAYPGGHYRYGVTVGGRHYAVKDALYRETDTDIALGLPIKDLHVFATTRDDSEERKHP